jgi:hypothetical protein
MRGGGGGVAGSQPIITVVYKSPNKLWRSNSIFNLRFSLFFVGSRTKSIILTNRSGIRISTGKLARTYLGRPVGIAGLFGVEDLVKGSAGFGKPVLVPPTVPVPA